MIVADECVAKSILRALRAAGHELIPIRDLAPRSPDEAVLGIARERGGLILTADLDFGDLVIRGGLSVDGVILYRLPTTPSAQVEVLMRHLSGDLEPFYGYFTVITERGIRQRPLVQPRSAR